MMLVLYYSPGACSFAPHIALEETGLPFEARRIVLAEGEHKTEQYRSTNPRERVPALVVDGQTVTEVPALLAYIASLRPELQLAPPPASLEYARCFELMAFLSSSLHIAYAQLWRPERFLDDHLEQRELFSQLGRKAIRRFSAEIDGAIAEPWALGELYSIADAYLLPFYRWGMRIGLPMASDYPCWTSWCGRMMARPAVQRATDREGIGLDWAPQPEAP